MNENEFKACATRLQQIAKVLEKLPAEVRSDAFGLLKDYVTAGSSKSSAGTIQARDQHATTGQSDEAFFAGFDRDKPADNAKLIAAWFYREYGATPFSVGDVRQKADAVGITIPVRVDNTFLYAQEKGKKLFAKVGKGKFKPTVHGEVYLKATYSVNKGTKKREGDAE